MHAKTLLILFPIVCFSLLFNVLDVLSAEPGETNALFLNCGSNDGGKDADGRMWEPDAKYLASTDSKMVKALFQDPSLDSAIPYMSARVFMKEGTYKFPVQSNQRYLVRFFFYPAAYPELDVFNSYISVTANDVILMNNFSSSITAKAFTQGYIIREYNLAGMDSDVLQVTFKASDKYPGSFAYVNGIEVIPSPDLFENAIMVGVGSREKFEVKSFNFQTMHRLNVGGQYISPRNDSGGLMRTWYDDISYIPGAAVGVSLAASANDKIDYKDMPNYIAPVNIYNSARLMGSDSKVNSGYNLTWLLQVDPSFVYLVRLHFCDFIMTGLNQRVFNIYINNQTAQVHPEAADVIGWSGGKGVTTYRDYAVQVKDRPEDGEVRVEISPAKETRPQFYDAILNGLEVIKIESGKNLSGPNPQLSEMLSKAEGQENKTFQTKDDNSKIGVIGGAAGGAAALGLVAAICIVVYHRKKRAPGTDSHTSSWLPVYGQSHTTASKSTISGKSNASSHLSAMAQGLCRRFLLSEIKHITRNFDESSVIGVGGFGKVYKGVLEEKLKVAIKRSNPSSEQGVNEFVTEIEMLSKLRHKHLVSLIGFCEEENEMCLVYDYMALGTLREHLYNTKKPHLSWKQRLEICIGAARGLHYLHTGAKYTIIHRDVKTTNILLDENWVAKVSDFGLSKTGPNMDNGHVSTVVKGSFGYLDPEYFRRQQLTEKSDIYSFGVVLFEVLCARPALNPSLPKEQVSLADWALHCKRKGILEDIVDPHLKGQISSECLKKFSDTAEKCLSDHGLERPSMGDVLWNLEFALQLVENSEGPSTTSRSETNTSSENLNVQNRNVPLHVHNLSLGSEQGSEGSTDDNSAIFSQIVNPKGR